MAAQRAQWGSRVGFILAAAGSAVGLGNIWRFPFMAGDNGGGWFVLIYLVCVALIGLPIMAAEIMIGRSAQKQPVAAFHTLQGGRSAWAGVGWLGVGAGFVILSYYVVIAGWAMDYTLKSVVNFSEPIRQRAEGAGIAYRATTEIDDMRLELARAEADKEAGPRIRAIRNQIRPSSWAGYERYRAALAGAEVVDARRIEIRSAAWEGHDGLAPEGVGVEISDAERERHDQVRARLLERPDLERQVTDAESKLGEIEAVTVEELAEARDKYEAMADERVRDEAEERARRASIRDEIQSAFGAVAGDGWMSLFWTSLFMLITIAIVAGGISGGIERACGVLMPMLFVLIVTLVVYGMFRRGFGEAVGFVFKPDATKLQPSGVMGAMGQAFFSLSLGMGAMITYGSYQKSKAALAGQSVTIASLDTAVALLACLMIFPIVFSYGQEPASGPGLVFMSMPLAFAEMGTGGMVLSMIFFGLLFFAALTSSISLLEVVASYFIDELGWARRRSVWTLGGLIFLFAIPSAFAGDPDFAMTGWAASYGIDFLTTMDSLASNWMLPAGGFFIAIYAGWVMPARLRAAEVEDLPALLYTGWLFLVRFVAPAIVVVILLQSVGVLDADELFFELVN